MEIQETVTYIDVHNKFIGGSFKVKDLRKKCHELTKYKKEINKMQIKCTCKHRCAKKYEEHNGMGIVTDSKNCDLHNCRVNQK